MSTWEKWVSPAGSGTGDGSSAANAHAMATAADRTWLLAQRAAMHTALVADSTQRGLNIADTFQSVTAGTDPDYNIPAYVPTPVNIVIAGRIYWISDQGEYPITVSVDSGVWLTTTVAHGGVLGDGTLGNPHRFIQMVALRSADSKLPDDVSGGIETRTVTLPVKDPAADANSTANYTAGLWTGATVSQTRTWIVTRPSPVRAVLRGNRTSDPRPNKTRYMWNVSLVTTTTACPADPDDETSVEPRVKQADGVTPLFLTQGQYVNLDTKAVTTAAWTAAGPYVFSEDGSCVMLQGFECRDVQAVTTFGSSSKRFLSYRDFREDNARYFNFRNNYTSDVEFLRHHLTSISQKTYVHGLDNTRWFLRDVLYDGEWVIGDAFQSLSGVAATNNAGPFVIHRAIVERAWGAVSTTATYVQGDGVDFEGRGLSIKDYYCDKTCDGGIDTKTAPYWLGWPAVTVCNAFLSRNKRSFRSWAPQIPEDMTESAKWIIRDATTFDPRQYGLYVVVQTPHHKHVDWENPDGRPQWAGTRAAWNPVAQEGTAGVSGDADLVVRRAFDARTSVSKGAMTSSGFNSNTVRGVTAPPYRTRLYLPVANAPTLTATINGASVTAGTRLQVSDGTQLVVVPAGVPAGGVVTYTVTGPADGLSQAGNDLTVTVHSA